MSGNNVLRIRTIAEFHKYKGLAPPRHPLISIINYGDTKCREETEPVNLVVEFYNIAVKRGIGAKYKYGQQQYDFDEGVMFFLGPNQVFGVEATPPQQAQRTGWMLLFHPDLLWGTHLATHIRKYDYFDYEVNEALFLSDEEEQTLNTLIENIRQEINRNTDQFSQHIIVSLIETLLNYSDRFYKRQFITRRIANHQILDRLEKLLDNYFVSDDLAQKGLPSVQYLAEALNLSPSYLSALLKELTGQTTQQHIHGKLIAKAKEKLSTTDLTVSEIAYALGFGQSQSFSKLFKIKTKQSPLEFRQSFN
ncbi:MAG TPA: helix-turn-helix transcriptional regulator [Saprospiraceae bacterium]|nr:helix-turn-helix transcriptional regulator [Saprospiraceae bacterium]MCB9272072.1 helix-turn-helix transcriptional regulator [Lewinellaceae bacterium]HPG07101.1 helix-turn-helix transcriptional regulator [Saprospiraceae bacterium]HPQ97908.1 helix-turn-helix transcriptional regulator [Saprospiraceae bacterium]HQU52374.1 helix-turn-helix transcriptional regulator [Saprospiraceae bacterium]